MENLKIYEIENSYIDHLVPFAPHLFHNKKENQENERKYIGIILTVNRLDYFAPLSSFKEKHKKMKNNMDFLKIGNYAVINLNNMFPVPKSQCTYVDISKESNPSYKALLSAEYRIITSLTERILKNAKSLYEYKMKNGNSTPLAKRCNDFKLLEEKCKEYYAKPFVQTLFSKNNELSSHRFCLQSVCYQTCFVNFIRSFVVQPLMNPFTIEELYKFPETFSQFLCA